ncbi:hypothetical protein VNO77_16835 [Canavalia gladiata]|uniref:Uncharacterized protein n=1 Tax=Canavalia gladiata TaxID=3824 RepID=A0AAN9LI07_CANGL
MEACEKHFHEELVLVYSVVVFHEEIYLWPIKLAVFPGLALFLLSPIQLKNDENHKPLNARILLGQVRAVSRSFYLAFRVGGCTPWLVNKEHFILDHCSSSWESAPL